MMHIFFEGGPFMWPLLAFAIAIVVLTVKKLPAAFGGREADQVDREGGINAILFWGSMSLVTGFLAHYTGIYSAMQAISRASDISPAVMARGYAQSLVPILTGLLICVASAVAWFVLRWRCRKGVFEDRVPRDHRTEGSLVQSS